MRLGLLTYCLGLMLTALATDLDSLQLLLAILLPSCALVLLCLWQLPASPILVQISRSLILLLWFFAGSAWHCHWAQSILHQRLPFELEGVEMLVTGMVLDLPSRNARAQQFTFEVLESDRGFAKRKILLNYYGGDRNPKHSDEAIIPGQHYQFLLRLNRPHGFANPAGFDYGG